MLFDLIEIYTILIFLFAIKSTIDKTGKTMACIVIGILIYGPIILRVFGSI